MYSKSTVYVVGNSKTNIDNAITMKYNSFFIGFVVDACDDTIIDLSSSVTLSTTDEFLKSIFIGRKMTEAYSETEEEMKVRYHGSSQRAILVAFKDASIKYSEIKAKHF